MEWIDEGIVLSARPHGETAMIVTLLTQEHGSHAGLVQGGQSRSKQPTLQIGNHVQARWTARLVDHLGNWSLEPLSTTSARWLSDPEILAIIASTTAIVEASLPERQPMPHLFASLIALFSIEDRSLWAPAMIRWEMGVLEALGYGMDISCCALTGATEGLAFISPRTGRAVTHEAAVPYQGKLLTLPAFLCGGLTWDEKNIMQGLELTGHFLERHVFAHPQNRRLVPIDGHLPAARQRLTDYYRNKMERVEEVA